MALPFPRRGHLQRPARPETTHPPPRAPLDTPRPLRAHPRLALRPRSIRAGLAQPHRRKMPPPPRPRGARAAFRVPRARAPLNRAMRRRRALPRAPHARARPEARARARHRARLALPAPHARRVRGGRGRRRAPDRVLRARADGPRCERAGERRAVPQGARAAHGGVCAHAPCAVAHALGPP